MNDRIYRFVSSNTFFVVALLIAGALATMGVCRIVEIVQERKTEMKKLQITISEL